MKLKKKAQEINAVTTLITGIGVAILVLVLIGVLSGQSYEITEDDINSLAASAVSGESFVGRNDTNVSLTNNDLVPGSVKVYNSSNADIWNDSGTAATALFTVNYMDGTIRLLNGTGGTVPNGSTQSINYSHGYTNAQIGDHIRQGVISGFEGLETTGDFLPLIVIALVVVIILGLLLGLVVLRGRGSSGGSL